MKDISNMAFRGLTPRNAYINASSWIRKVLGPEYLGHAALGKIGDFSGTILLPSAGFLDEIEPLLDRMGRTNSLLLRLEGGAWDSRSRLEIDAVTTIDVAKEGDFAAAARRAADWACAVKTGRLAA
jgi:hypothetical protein